MAGSDNHFSLMGEGLGIIKALDESSASFFSDMSRLREIIIKLGEGSETHQSSLHDIDFSNPKEAFDFISNSVKNIGSLPEAQREVELIYCRTLLRNTAAQDIALEDRYAMEQEISNAMKGSIDANALFEFYSSNSPDFDIGFAVEYPAKFHAEVLSYKEKPESTPEWEKEYAAIMDEKSKIRAFRDSLLNESKKEPNNAINEKVQDAQDKLFELEEKQREMVRYKYDEWNKRCDELIKNQLEPIGKKIISTMLEKSPVTKEQADKWVSGLSFEDKAVKKLEKHGYRIEDLRRDMAELYRLTGGKIPPFTLNTDSKKRARATGILSLYSKKQIYVGHDFSKTTLFHEMAHHLENDGMAREAANGFLQKRRVSEKVVKLKKLDPYRGYKSNEFAWKDDFVDPYVGKKYDDRITEVLSMGVEVFADPVKTALLYSQDNEMMKLISGYMVSGLTPSMSAILRLQNENKAGVDDDVDTKEDVYKGVIKKLSDGVSISYTGWPRKLDSENLDYLYDNVLFARNSNAEYIGSASEFIHVFSGKFRNAKTRRYAKGYKVIRVSTNSNTPFRQEGVHVSGNSDVNVHGDEDYLKAFIWIAMNVERPLTGIYMEYFLWDFDHEKLIKLAGIK